MKKLVIFTLLLFVIVTKSNAQTPKLSESYKIDSLTKTQLREAKQIATIFSLENDSLEIVYEPFLKKVNVELKTISASKGKTNKNSIQIPSEIFKKMLFENLRNADSYEPIEALKERLKIQIQAKEQANKFIRIIAEQDKVNAQNHPWLMNDPRILDAIK